MVSDSVNANAIQSVPKDLGNKKKRARNARLKQCKLDARREQWLSQGKIKGECKEEGNRVHVPPAHNQGSLENLEVEQRGVGEVHCHVHHHEDSDLDSLSSSPTKAASDKDLESNFTGSSSSSSSSSSGGSSSGSFTEAEDEDDEGNNRCLDDWEAMADDLEADDKQKSPSSDELTKKKSVVETDFCCKNTSDSKPDNAIRRHGSTCAWRTDDVSRPQSLPNLSKQLSLPNSGCFPKPLCPICYEELDTTELSFLPCLCGFRLCLFCHNRILEEDGRCPGCRKPYEKKYIDSEASVNAGSPKFQFGRSCTMITRS